MKQKVMVFLFLLAGWMNPTQSFAANLHVSPIHIIIDVGHGGIDGGTSYGDIYEKDINMAIAKLLYQELTADGYEVVLNRTGDYALSDENDWLNSRSRHFRDLAQRKQLAAELSPELMVSLHVNWSSRSQANGPIVLYQQNNQSFLVADLLQHSLDRLYNTKREPKAGKTYYLLRHSICPSIIVEMGFLSNPSDRQRLTTPSEQGKIAKAMDEAINEYFLLVGHIQQQSKEDTWIEIFKRLLKKMW